MSNGTPGTRRARRGQAPPNTIAAVPMTREELVEMLESTNASCVHTKIRLSRSLRCVGCDQTLRSLTLLADPFVEESWPLDAVREQYITQKFACQRPWDGTRHGPAAKIKVETARRDTFARACKFLKEKYGHDISPPATNNSDTVRGNSDWRRVRLLPVMDGATEGSTQISAPVAASAPAPAPAPPIANKLKPIVAKQRPKKRKLEIKAGMYLVESVATDMSKKQAIELVQKERLNHKEMMRQVRKREERLRFKVNELQNKLAGSEGAGRMQSPAAKIPVADQTF